MERAADIEVLPSWAQRAWKQLRAAVFIGMVAASFAVGIMKAWNEMYPSAEPATAEEVQDSNNELRAAIVQVSDSMMRAALGTYTDSLNVVRQHIEDSVARPIYKAIIDLDRRTTRIESRMVEAGMAIEEQRQTTAAANAELLDRLEDRSDNAAILEALAEIMDRQDELEKQIQKARSTKGRF